MKLAAHPTKAFTLVEVLISTSIFLLAITAILTALLLFLRIHHSYSATAAFSSKVRVNHEKMMQELRNAIDVTEASDKNLTIDIRDLAGVQWKVEYYAPGGGTRLLRKATPTSGTPIVTEVYDKLTNYSFKYYGRDGTDLGATPSDKKKIRGIQLEVTPKARPSMFFGSDAETLRLAGTATVSNAVILLRNAQPSS